MKRGDCGCRNRRGARKIKYPSRDAALSAILRFYCRDGLPHSVYPCPRGFGCFHITTARR